MPPPARRRPLLLLLPAALALAGCASPGVPRPPSLNLPASARDLAATRRGNTVEVTFTLPTRNTDHLPLRGNTIAAQLCRSVDGATCTPILTPQTFPTALQTPVTLTDPLPSTLATGSPRLLLYRVQLANDTGHAAGFSDAVYVAAGSPPPPVEDLTLQGSRLGVILTWQPAPANTGSVYLRREDLNPKPSKPKPTTPSKPTPKSTKPTTTPSATHHQTPDPNIVWLSATPEPAFQLDAAPGTAPTPTRPNAVLDDTALPNEPYRYSAERRLTVTLGGRTLELRSPLTTPQTFTLRDIYPPPAPTDPTAAVFSTNNTLAVDLVWQPVDDPRLTGYNLYRQPVDPDGKPLAPELKLNSTPIPAPGFHDVLPAELPADATTPAHFRYAITATDAHGNESPRCLLLVDPTAK